MSRCGQTVLEKLDWLNLGLLKDDLTARSDHKGRVVELISWRGSMSDEQSAQIHLRAADGEIAQDIKEYPMPLGFHRHPGGMLEPLAGSVRNT